MSQPAAEARHKALGVSLEPDVFRTLAYHARRHEMSVRDFLAHLAKSYVEAMEQAQQGSSRGR